MTGGHSSVEIRLEGDKAILVTEEQEWHNSDLTKVTYTLPADVMDKLKDLIIDADVPTLSKRGMSDIFAYDAATYSFSCYFEGVDYYSVSQNQKKSGAEADKLYAIRTYLYSLAQQNEGVTEIIKGTAQDDN